MADKKIVTAGVFTDSGTTVKKFATYEEAVFDAARRNDQAISMGLEVRYDATKLAAPEEVE